MTGSHRHNEMGSRWDGNFPSVSKRSVALFMKYEPSANAKLRNNPKRGHCAESQNLTASEEGLKSSDNIDELRLKTNSELYVLCLMAQNQSSTTQCHLVAKAGSDVQDIFKSRLGFSLCSCWIGCAIQTGFYYHHCLCVKMDKASTFKKESDMEGWI